MTTDGNAREEDRLTTASVMVAMAPPRNKLYDDAVDVSSSSALDVVDIRLTKI